MRIRSISGYARMFSDAPFSGQQSSESLQTFVNGAHESSSGVRPMVYRDSKGRLRIEQPAYHVLPGRPAPSDDFTIVEIKDPVAGYQYVLDPVSHVAHRQSAA